jgi:hypothetical protein
MAARAHAEAVDEALRESVATKLDIALAVRDTDGSHRHGSVRRARFDQIFWLI